MPSAVTIDRVKKQIDKLENMSPDETRAKLTALPVQMVYEQRFALQTIIQQAQQNPSSDDYEVIEPLARGVGWTEALVFALSATHEREALKSLFGTSPKFS